MPYIGKQPANVPVTADDIPNDSITAAKIVDAAITIDDIGPNAVGNSEMADDAIGLNELSATGTTNSSTFLRGDNTWAVPPDNNTTYSVQDGQLSQNNFTDADHSKLNAIEASADVTDATNVSAAGALMKSGGTMTGTIAGFTSTGIDDNADATAITIDSSEKVGIGTSSPTESLQVHGAIRSTNNATTTLADSGNFYYIPTADDGSNPRTVISGVGTSSVGGHVTFKTGTSGSNTEKMRIDSSGNVSIGATTSGNYKFLVSGAQFNVAEFKRTNNYGTIINVTNGTGTSLSMGMDDDEVRYLGSSTTKYLDFGSSGSNAKFHGAVGIGTSSPAVELEVNGDVASSTRRNYTITRAHTGTTINLLVSDHSANSASGRWFTVKGATCGPGNAGQAGMYEFTLRAYSGDGTGGTGVYNFAILSSTVTTAGSANGSTPTLSWSGSGSTRTLVLNAPSWQGSSGVVEFGGYQAPGNVTWA